MEVSLQSAVSILGCQTPNTAEVPRQRWRRGLEDVVHPPKEGRYSDYANSR
jgi:hypothetical protein